MRKRFPTTIVRVLLALALVAGLVAVTAAPAGAQAVASVVLSPATAGDGATYTINVTTGVSTYAVLDTITITFPNGIGLPSTINRGYVKVGGTPFATIDPGGVSVIPANRQVIITMGNAAQAAAMNTGTCAIEIGQAAGITNPLIAKTAASLAYPLSVATSVEGTFTPLTGYEVLPSYSISPAAGDRTTVVTVTGKGWAAGTSVVLGGGVSGFGTIQSDGTFSVASAPSAAGGNVTVLDGAGQTAGVTTPQAEPGDGSNPWVGTVTTRSFTLLPTITPNPTGGLVGSTVAVTGYDFGSTATTIATVLFGSTAATPSTTTLVDLDADTVSDDIVFTTTVPALLAGGTTVVRVTDNLNNYATANYDVTAHTLTVSPTGGPPLSTVTITGAGFAASATGGTVVMNPLGTPLTLLSGVSTNANGGFSQSAVIPAGAVGGVNMVLATVAGATAGTTFTVGTRVATVNPTSGPRGTSVTVGAGGLTAGTGSVGLTYLTDSVSITGTAAAWNTSAIDVDSLGNMVPTQLTIPAATPWGIASITVADGTYTATTAFTVTQPTLTVDKTEGYKGDTLTLTGSGWVPGVMGQVTILFRNSAAVTLTLVTSTPDADGAFTAQLTVPPNASAQPALNTIVASDTAIYGNTAATKSFKLLNPALTVSPAEGPVGTDITITGVGFTPQTSVTNLGFGATPPAAPAGIYTDTMGSFTATLTVPGLATGGQVIAAQTAFEGPITASFAIIAGPATVVSAVATISDELVRVWGYSAGAWQMYDPADPIGSDLASLTEGSGYWVNVDADCTLIFGGSSWDLTAGWNLIGW